MWQMDNTATEELKKIFGELFMYEMSNQVKKIETSTDKIEKLPNRLRDEISELLNNKITEVIESSIEDAIAISQNDIKSNAQEQSDKIIKALEDKINHIQDNLKLLKSIANAVGNSTLKIDEISSKIESSKNNIEHLKETVNAVKLSSEEVRNELKLKLDSQQALLRDVNKEIKETAFASGKKLEENIQKYSSHIEEQFSKNIEIIVEEYTKIAKQFDDQARISDDNSKTLLDNFEAIKNNIKHLKESADVARLSSEETHNEIKLQFDSQQILLSDISKATKETVFSSYKKLEENIQKYSFRIEELFSENLKKEYAKITKQLDEQAKIAEDKSKKLQDNFEEINKIIQESNLKNNAELADFYTQQSKQLKLEIESFTKLSFESFADRLSETKQKCSDILEKELASTNTSISNVNSNISIISEELKKLGNQQNQQKIVFGIQGAIDEKEQKFNEILNSKDKKYNLFFILIFFSILVNAALSTYIILK